MSKKVDTFHRAVNKIKALVSSMNPNIPNGNANKGVKKQELIDLTHPSVRVIWNKEGISPLKAVIEDDYTLEKLDLSVVVHDKIIEIGSNFGNIVPALINSTVTGGIPPYTYRWSALPPFSENAFGSDTMPGLSLNLNRQYGQTVWSPFILTVTDSTGAAAIGSGEIKLIITSSGSNPPVTTTPPAEVRPESPLLTYIIDESNGDVIRDITIEGAGNQILNLMADTTGGVAPYTYSWKYITSSNSVQYSSTTRYSTVATLNKGHGEYRILLEVTDGSGAKTHANLVVNYIAENVPEPEAPPAVDEGGNSGDVIKCDGSFNPRGGLGYYHFEVEFGTKTGTCGINYNMMTIPDSAYIIWDNKVVAVTGHTVPPEGWSYAGRPALLETPKLVSGTGSLTFNKNKPTPTKAEVIVQGVKSGTAWNISGICP